MTIRVALLFAMTTALLTGCGEPREPTSPPPPPIDSGVDGPVDETTDDGPTEPARRLSERIPPEERLLYLEVDPTSYFGGALRSGDHVDVVGWFDEDPEPTATTLLQNVTVLDAATVDEATKVALSLTVDEVEMLVAARRGGELSLLGRRPGDTEVETVQKTDLRQELENLEVLQERRQIRRRARIDEPTTDPDERFVERVGPEERAMMLRHGFPGDYLHVGDRVDIFGVMEVEQPDGRTQPVATTLLQNVAIIDVDDDRVTLTVTPEEAKLLTLARRRGELLLTLRNREDIEVSAITRKTLKSVLADLEVIQLKRRIRTRRRPRKKSPAIEIIRGDAPSTPSANSPSIDLAPQPGQLTAGEWRDLEHWEHWRELATPSDSPSPDNFSRFVRKWSVTTRRIYPVVVRDFEGDPITDADVTLHQPRTGRPVWRARTDNRGRAWLFDGISTATSDSALDIVASFGGETVSALVDGPGDVTELTLGSTAKRSDALDVMLVVDTTGSMTDELDYLQSELRDVLQNVEADHPAVELRTSVNFYRDEDDDYVVRPYPFTSTLTKAERWLMSQSTDGGGDTPEAVDRALIDAVNEHEWSADARARLLFVVLDAPPHDDGAIRFRQAIETAASKGIRVIPIVASGMAKQGEYLMRVAAIATGGTYVFLTDDSGIGDAHTQPTAGPHDVGYLNDLLAKLVGEWVR